MTTDLLDLLSFSLLFPFLAYASWSDVRTGFASNRLWFWAWIVGVALSLGKFMVIGLGRTLALMAIPLVLTLMLSVFFFEVRLLGGSDAKALVTLSIFVPMSNPLFCRSAVEVIPSLLAMKGTIIFLMLSVFFNLASNLALCLLDMKPSISSDSMNATSIVRNCATMRLELPRLISTGAYETCSYLTGFPLGDEAGELKRNSELLAIDPHLGDVACLSWVPLRIPLIPVITLTFIVSILFGGSLPFLL